MPSIVSHNFQTILFSTVWGRGVWEGGDVILLSTWFVILVGEFDCSWINQQIGNKKNFIAAESVTRTMITSIAQTKGAENDLTMHNDQGRAICKKKQTFNGNFTHSILPSLTLRSRRPRQRRTPHYQHICLCFNSVSRADGRDLRYTFGRRERWHFKSLLDLIKTVIGLGGMSDGRGSIVSIAFNRTNHDALYYFTI